MTADEANTQVIIQVMTSCLRRLIGTVMFFLLDEEIDVFNELPTLYTLHTYDWVNMFIAVFDLVNISSKKIIPVFWLLNSAVDYFTIF